MPIAILLAALIGPHATPSADQLREEFHAVLNVSAARVRPETAVVVPRLVSLYVALENIEALPRAERTKMRKAVESRLVVQLESLLKERRIHEATLRRDGSMTNAGGGAVPFAAQQLIDLIVTTIAPDSWKTNGGRGTISYYPRVPALVIRATDEVHDESAALLNALRRQ